MGCLVRSSSLATLPYSMKNLIGCFYFLDVQHSITTVLQPQDGNLLDYSVTVQYKKNANFNFVVLSLNDHAHFQYKAATREKSLALQNRTRSTLS